jgi:hypothetical protein
MRHIGWVRISIALSLFAEATGYGQLAAPLEKFRGIYSVPMEGPQDTALNEFPAGSVKVWRDGEHVAMRYRFPYALDGIGTRIELRGTIDSAGILHMADLSVGTMDCVPDAETMKCTAHYPNLAIDPEARSLALQEMSASTSELAAREAVARQFDGERIGVLQLQAGDDDF